MYYNINIIKQRTKYINERLKGDKKYENNSKQHNNDKRKSNNERKTDK